VPGLLRAIAKLPKEIQVILCAGAPDTPEIAAETRTLVDGLQADRPGVVWIEKHLPREQIVEGAVSMVDQALQRLEDSDIVALDDERRAQMVSNLLVVLCSDQRTQPVVNAGSLYA